MRAKRYVLSCYAAWMALLIAVSYGLRGLRMETRGLIFVTAVIAVVAGAWINRPARKAPWLLLAAALASFAVGRLSFLTIGKLAVRLPVPTIADSVHLLAFPLFAAGLLIFIRWRTPERYRGSLIDALTLTLSLALLSWSFLIRPYAHNLDFSGIQESIVIAYPVGDVLLLVLITKHLAPGMRGVRCIQLLALAAIGHLASDAAFSAMQLHTAFHLGLIVHLGWALFYTACGASALHPSMARLTEPVTSQLAQGPSCKLTVLASLIAPAMLVIGALEGTNSNLSVIAVVSAVLYLLVLSRRWEATKCNRRSLNRERVLRQTGLSLVTAGDMTEVAATMKAAVGELLGEHSRGGALLGVRVNGALRDAAEPCTEPARPSQLLGALADTMRGRLTGTAPILAPMRQLPGQVPAKLPRSRWMLLCPVTLNDSPSEKAPDGLIAAFGEHRILTGISATLEILAHQVALTVESITLRQSADRQRNEAYFRALVQDASDAIMIVGDDGLVKYATPSALTIYGDFTLAGERMWDLVAEQEREAFGRYFAELREAAVIGPRFVDQQITRRDGRTVHIQCRCSDLRDDPTVEGLVFTLRDVTEQRGLEEEMKHRAWHDALTGLPNRVLLQDRIANQIAAAGRTALIAGVLFIDLDDFKVVNDTMGHNVGDELLVAASARLAGLVRDSDTAARLGGDEFALLIANAEGTDAVEAAAERVVRAFAEPFALTSGLVTNTVTVGVATTLDSADTEELLKHADLALYAAKAAGKRQWRRYQPVLSAGLLRRREIQEALEKAVDKSEFTLAYQPIVALDTGELAGFEALVRWPHPQWGIMQPSQFIPLAEETGQIIALGAWVLERATADLARWRADMETPGEPDEAYAGATWPGGQHAEWRRDLYVSVNVSARQFADPSFACTVRRALASSGLEAAALTLELTESALLHRDEKMYADLAELKAIGVRLALDDFGTGYSSLSYLRELPINLVKMDKSFVDGIAESEPRLALAEGIVALARTLRLEVVAEGIETEIQRDLLTSMGCHYGQGFLLARPMPPGEAAGLARTGFSPAVLVPAPRR